MKYVSETKVSQFACKTVSPNEYEIVFTIFELWGQQFSLDRQLLHTIVNGTFCFCSENPIFTNALGLSTSVKKVS